MLQLALTDIMEYNKKVKLQQFNFRYIKKEIGLEENEKMSGTAYEDFARKSFIIMLMMITQNKIYFSNPNKVPLKNLIKFYFKILSSDNSNRLKIKTTIHDIMSTNLIDTNMEIDIITELKLKDINDLFELFPKNIIFKHNLENIKENDDTVTIIGEIARNIIIQGNEKLKQIIKYIELIAILNIYKDNLGFSITPVSSLCEFCKMDVITEKIFCLITDGDYIILKNIYQDIIKDLIANKQDKTEDIRNKIKEKIINNNDLMEKMNKNDKEIELLKEKIYDNYLIIDKLRENEIKFFVLYIGDIEQFIYYDELILKIVYKQSLIKEKKKEFDNIENLIKDKYNLNIVKEKTKQLKEKISLFIQDINQMTENQLNQIKIIFDSVVKDKNILYSSKISDEKAKNEFKFDLIFNLILPNDPLKNKIQLIQNGNLFKDFKFIKSIKVKEFKKKKQFLNEFLKDLHEFTEPKTFKIYIICDKDIDIDDYETIQLNLKYKSNFQIRYLYFNVNNEKYKVNLEKSNFQTIFENKFLNINKPIFDEINNLSKKVEYGNQKNKILDKQSLIHKLKSEFTILKINNSFVDEITKPDFSLEDTEYDGLLKYFTEAFQILDRNIDLKKTNNEQFKQIKEKIKKLSENLLSKKIYEFIHYKLFESINDNIYTDFSRKLNEFINSLNI